MVDVKFPSLQIQRRHFDCHPSVQMTLEVALTTTRNYSACPSWNTTTLLFERELLHCLPMSSTELRPLVAIRPHTKLYDHDSHVWKQQCGKESTSTWFVHHGLLPRFGSASEHGLLGVPITIIARWCEIANSHCHEARNLTLRMPGYAHTTVGYNIVAHSGYMRF